MPARTAALALVTAVAAVAATGARAESDRVFLTWSQPAHAKARTLPLRDAARAFLRSNPGLLALDAGDAELVEIGSRRDRLSREHVVLERLVSGLPLEGATLRIHSDPDGRLRSLHGTPVALSPSDRERIEELACAPRPDAAAIERIVAADLAALGDGDVLRIDERAVAGPPWVAWIARASLVDGRRVSWRIDGASGAILSRRVVLQTASPSVGTGVGVFGDEITHLDTWRDSTYSLQDLSRRATNDVHGHRGQMRSGESIATYRSGLFFPRLVTDDDDVWTDDPAAVDAHRHAATVYDWLLQRFGLSSPDGLGSSMESILRSCAKNASWNGSNVTYCEGSWDSLAGCLDVVAHEWAHAVTELAPGPLRDELAYEGESGALNEAFSDWVGVAVEFAAGEDNWTLGEPSFTIRDLSDPSDYGQPESVGDARWFDLEGCVPSDGNDWCGVHRNSGVPNKMFHLLSAGGTFRDVTVTGLGIDRAIGIAFDANVSWWPSNATFEDARDGMVEAARPQGLLAMNAVRNAWAAVGVGERVLAYTTGSGDVVPELPDGLITGDDVERLRGIALAREPLTESLLARADIAPALLLGGEPALAQPAGDARVSAADVVLATLAWQGVVALP